MRLDYTWWLTGVKVVAENVVVVLSDGVQQPTPWKTLKSVLPALPASSRQRKKYVRLIYAGIAEQASRDLVENTRELGRLLLERDRVIHVLVTEVFDVGRQVPKED